MYICVRWLELIALYVSCNSGLCYAFSSTSQMKYSHIVQAKPNRKLLFWKSFISTGNVCTDRQYVVIVVVAKVPRLSAFLIKKKLLLLLHFTFAPFSKKKKKTKQNLGKTTLSKFWAVRRCKKTNKKCSDKL